jgi:hypothetical protein
MHFYLPPGNFSSNFGMLTLGFSGPPAMKLITMVEVSNADEEDEDKIAKLLTVSVPYLEKFFMKLTRT